MLNYIKPTLDIILSLIGIILFSPIVIIYSFLFLVITKTNPIFIQERSVDGEKYFPIYKLRTLEKDSVTKPIDYKGVKRELAKGDYLLFGKLMRKSGLDELPQLLNVLKGEMSLIGPRPFMREDIEDFRTNNELLFNERKRLKSKPGICGIWQLERGENLDYEELLRFDKSYQENQSIRLEIEILFSTMKKMITINLSDSLNGEKEKMINNKSTKTGHQVIS